MDGGAFGLPFGILLDGLKDRDIPDAGHPGFHNGACLVHPQGCGLDDTSDPNAARSAHDPNQQPPDGFSSWAEVDAHNRDVIAASLVNQRRLEAAGYRYNSSNGTWTGPQGDTVNDLRSGPADADPAADPRFADPNA